MQSKKLLLGIDIGTSSIKAAVFEPDGKVISQSMQEIRVYYPAPGHVEQNPNEWWDGICRAVKDMLFKGNVKPCMIAGIGIDGQSWSAIPMDKQGKVLHNTPIWMDTRSAGICKKEAYEPLLEKIFRISGNIFKPSYSTPKILWFKEYKPDIFDNTYKFLQSNSFAAYKLTGKITQDISQGYGLHVFNVHEGKWDSELCDELGIPQEKLPQVFNCSEVIGEVTSEAAGETGLVPGTPVVAGGLDAACGALGAGVILPGETQEQGGQAGGMSICLDRAISHPMLILSSHVVPRLWLLQGGTVGGSGVLEWFRRELGGFEIQIKKDTHRSIYEIIDEEAAGVDPGSGGMIFLPYMAGERSPIWDENAKGIFFGLSYDKTRAHMIRAMLEGCAYSLLHNVKSAEETGVRVDVLNAIGGASNSKIWTQIKADVTGRKIRVSSSGTATTLGAAILAGVGTGVYKDFNEAVARTVKLTRTHEPDMAKHEDYLKYYEIYLELYDRLKETMKKISGFED